jgi:D-aminoacyl-tRNA deacylase
MKPLVVISKPNAASQNIKGAILKLENPADEGGFWRGADFDMAEYDGEITRIEPEHGADYYVYASTHRSAAGTPSFTVHTPGNWGSAEMGGREKTLNTSLPSRMKAAAQELARLSAASLGWPVSIEADHHGPTLEKPLMFVEIGSGEAHWGAREAGEIAARAILAAIRNTRTWQVHIGFGGSHYAPKFGPMVISGNEAFGHIISGYALEKYGLDESRLMQAMVKNAEKPAGAMIDWKGVKGGVKAELKRALDSLSVPWSRA